MAFGFQIELAFRNIKALVERGKTEHADTNDAPISANPMAPQVYILNPSRSRLRVVSNFGDSDRGVGENTHAKFRGRRGAPLIFGALLASRLLEISRAPHHRYRHN